MGFILLLIFTIHLSAVIGNSVIKENSPYMNISCTGVNKADNASILRNEYNETSTKFDMVPLENDKRKGLKISINLTTTTPTIKLDITTPSSLNDDGEYECRFFSATKFETNRTTIHAVPYSRLCIGPDNDPNDKMACRSLAYPVGLNETVTITCKLAGFPLPSVQWYRGHIPTDVVKEIKESSKIDSTTPAVQVQMYTSSSVSPSASVTTAPLTSAPNATVLDKHGVPTQRAQGSYKFGPYKNVPNAVLILEGVTLADRDKYACVVKNEYGVRASEINLHIYSTHYVPRPSPTLASAPDVFSMYRSIA